MMLCWKGANRLRLCMQIKRPVKGLFVQGTGGSWEPEAGPPLSPPAEGLHWPTHTGNNRHPGFHQHILASFHPSPGVLALCILSLFFLFVLVSAWLPCLPFPDTFYLFCSPFVFVVCALLRVSFSHTVMVSLQVTLLPGDMAWR